MSDLSEKPNIESIESVGLYFSEDLLIEARNKTLDVLLEARDQIQPGMREKDARQLVLELMAQKGAPKSWHPPQIRFGPNTTLPFGKLGEDNPMLRENDIYFLDIGPLFSDHEGDVGRTFFVGNNPLHKKCTEDVAAIWKEVQGQWQTNHSTGEKLYDFAKRSAQEKGWRLSLEKADGHRISDFPHAAKKRGSIVGLNFPPQSNRWILEIQIQHPTEPFGAFFEDLLNEGL